MQRNLSAEAVQPVQAERLSELPWLAHAFSTRRGGVSTDYGRSGDLNLGFTSEDAREAVEENRRRFVQSVGGGWELVTVRQVHAATVLRVTGEGLPTGPGTKAGADGLITDAPGVLLGIQTADCVPVLIADPENRAVGAFHAGWRGTVGGIVEFGIARMAEEFGSRPGKLIAAIGPSIGACCYQVGEEVQAALLSNFAYGAELFSRGDRLDLKEANRRQLMAAGLLDENIQVIKDCTCCESGRYFSHRGQAGHTGRMLSVIGVRAEQTG